ncbi:MAG: glycosyltransferase family 2 protein [Candidatus Nanopelagicaceae bacterium]|nr:glycosyltransferase family 2 protein [Candidatus Nanopelagicaceae bacterium]
MTTHSQYGDKSHPRDFPPVSIILTVLNEESHLRSAIQAALNSDYQGEIEIVVAVAPSKDQTMQIAREIALKNIRVKVIENPSGKTPSGLNAALRNSRHEIVVRIDGHSEIESDYITKAVATLTRTGAVNVGGVMAAEGVTNFEKAVASAMRSPIGVGAAKFHTGGAEGATDTVYLGVFQRSAIEAIGGYDEEFVRAQDWEMNFRLREKGGVIWFNPDLKVTYRPRNSLRKLAKQYFEYGRWRRMVSRTHKGTINFRYLAPPVNLVINFLSISLGALLSPYFLIPSATYVLAILLSSAFIGKSWGERIRLPIVLITMHFSWGFGFISSPRNLIKR